MVQFQDQARLVIDAEQENLLDKYRLHKVTITPGDVRRDLIRALLITVPGSLFLTALLGRIGGPSSTQAFILILLVSTFFVYHQIREEVRVNDLLTGRDFKARSFLDLLGKEHAIRKMSVAFANVVDQARTWHEPEVIELEPQPLFPSWRASVRLLDTIKSKARDRRFEDELRGLADKIAQGRWKRDIVIAAVPLSTLAGALLDFEGVFSSFQIPEHPTPAETLEAANSSNSCLPCKKAEVLKMPCLSFLRRLRRASPPFSKERISGCGYLLWSGLPTPRQ